ncbi:serine/threonine-protein kinase [Kitasatospora viridis]|uniref:non-specific serine/threonine protein kinase n=1 Tax=Kitasatospora viridis TaxID=281105 RepID=A0A561TW81_9ACTN|nr:serine/threonine-protein kinase [Kitasatospora viridis]TWF91373.1 serine/threonine protein kinase [Kitasatospora viridis]
MNAVGTYVDRRYRLDKLLGRGGMGEVWRAHDLRLERPVAIKFLSTHTAVDRELLDRFQREARVTAGLRHPGITQVFDTGDWNGQLFLVMELIDGRDLAAVLKERGSPLPVEQAVELTAQAADALAHAHRSDVVHRDIKPANLMLLTDGRVKVCDFGIAGFIRADSELTRDGANPGTPAYMAPEQCLGQRVDGRADLYALGCVLYTLLTGRPPFASGGDYQAVMFAHINTPPPPLAERRPGLPVAVQHLVSALLSKDPAARPGNAAEVAARLRRLPLQPGGGASSVPPPPTEPPASSGIGLQVFQNEYLTQDAVEANAILTVTGADAGAGAPASAAAAPRSFVFLLGLSDRLPEADFRAVRQQVAEAVDRLDDGVAFALVAGSEYARMLYPDSMRLTRANALTRAEARAAVEQLRPVGAAAFGRWIRLADRLFTAHADTARTAVLLTDLVATGETPGELATALAASAGRFVCHARGIGTDWEVSQLRSITQALSGTVDIVAAPAADTGPRGNLAHELASLIESTRQGFARDLALRVRMPAGVGIRFLKQVAPIVADLTDRGAPVGPGTLEYPVELLGSASCDYHLCLSVPPGRVGDRMRAADLRVVLLPPAGDGQTLARQPVLVVRTDDLTESGRISPNVAHYTGQAELAQAIAEGLAEHRRGDEPTAG